MNNLQKWIFSKNEYFQKMDILKKGYFLKIIFKKWRISKIGYFLKVDIFYKWENLNSGYFLRVDILSKWIFSINVYSVKKGLFFQKWIFS